VLIVEQFGFGLFNFLLDLKAKMHRPPLELLFQHWFGFRFLFILTGSREHSEKDCLDVFPCLLNILTTTSYP
jgi:hypothetical protein